MPEKTNYDRLYVTRYMGSKYKLLDFIFPSIKKLLAPGGTLIDIMAGTHAVGYAAKKNYRVISNDIQYYSQVFGKALIENSNVLSLANRFQDDFINLSDEESEDDWFVKTYGDTYFSKKQCQEIVQIRRSIEKVQDQYAKYLYLTVLANTMSLCQSSSGHFAQYFPKNHPRVKSLRKMRIVDEFMKRCKEIELTKGRFSNQVMGYELSEFFQHGFQLAKVSGQTLVYLDPPYTSAQYSRYYHLIETVFLNDRPEVAFKGLYRSDRHQSNFCSSTKVEEAFENAIHLTSSRSCNLLISYSNAGLITLDRLKKLCKSYYPSVNLRLTNYAHSMQGRGQVSDRKEALLECQL